MFIRSIATRSMDASGALCGTDEGAFGKFRWGIPIKSGLWISSTIRVSIDVSGCVQGRVLEVAVEFVELVVFHLLGSSFLFSSFPEETRIEGKGIKESLMCRPFGCGPVYDQVALKGRSCSDGPRCYFVGMKVFYISKFSINERIY
jgi:hypothetical protein